jgi:hypothetical protein
MIDRRDEFKNVPWQQGHPMQLTPRDWQQIALREASELLGTPEGAAKLVEANRYGALADEIDRLTKERDAATHAERRRCAH